MAKIVKGEYLRFGLCSDNPWAHHSLASGEDLQMNKMEMDIPDLFITGGHNLIGADMSLRNCIDHILNVPPIGTIEIEGEEGLQYLVDMIRCAWEQKQNLIIECQKIIFDRGNDGKRS